CSTHIQRARGELSWSLKFDANTTFSLVPSAFFASGLGAGAPTSQRATSRLSERLDGSEYPRFSATATVATAAVPVVGGTVATGVVVVALPAGVDDGSLESPQAAAIRAKPSRGARSAPH